VVGFASVSAIAFLLIVIISLPLHVLLRRLSFRRTISDPRFLASSVSISLLVGAVVSLGDR
jgi:ABC-type sulfate transport system permease component